MTLDGFLATSVLLTVVWAVALAWLAMRGRAYGVLLVVLAVGQVLLLAILLFVLSQDR